MKGDHAKVSTTTNCALGAHSVARSTTMASRLKIWGACRTLAVRTQPVRLAAQPFRAQASSTRFYADDATNKLSNSPSGAKREASGSVSRSESRSTKATEGVSGELTQKAAQEVG